MEGEKDQEEILENEIRRRDEEREENICRKEGRKKGGTLSPYYLDAFVVRS